MNNQNKIWKALSQLLGVRLFRNNVGTGACGKKLVKQGKNILVLFARRVKFGLFKGSGDHIGWVSIVVTPEMVGKTIAEFVSIEEKHGTGRPSKWQDNWRNQVNKAGGIGIVAWSEEDAVQALRTRVEGLTKGGTV